MKIALLTIWHEKNYGAVLQAYATVKALRQLGYDPQMINIHLQGQVRPTLKGRVAGIIEKISPANYKFNRFWHDNIPLSRKYENIEELYKSPPEADCYMVGSDQVWNPDITKAFWKIFFLDFGPVNTKRVSYASSIGVEHWSFDSYTPIIKDLLKNFSQITCREESGVKILEKDFQVNARSVLDPTLLFDSFDEFAKKEPNIKTKKKTIVYYPLSKDVELEGYCNKLAKRLGYKLVNTNKATTILDKIHWNRVSIEEWVKNIANAEFVITRSFHGLAFCLIYHKQFAILKSRNGRGTRVENLLEKLGLQNRMFDSTEQIDTIKPWESLIDYSNVTPILNSLRQQSWDVLRNMLAE